MAKLLTTLGRALLACDPAQLETLLEDLDPGDAAAVDAVLSDPDFVRFARGAPYVADPCGFMTGVLSEFLWSGQRAILESVRDNRRTAVPACHGPGKSWTAAGTVAWWITSHPPGTAMALTTAPTGSQVRDILWKEINRRHSGGALPGRMNLAEWFIDDEIVALGRKPADTNPAALQGMHELFILIVLDEADGIAGTLWEAAETLVTTEHARMLAIGNPDSGAGPFFDACTPGSGWNVIRISAFDTPAFTGEVVPPDVLDKLVTVTWVEERRAKWGENDPRWHSKVLAQPPADNQHGVIPRSSVLACVHAGNEDMDFDAAPGPVAIGADIGRGGDLSVAWEARGDRLCRRWTETAADLTVATDGIEEFALQCAAEVIRVDSNGIGAGVFDELRRRARTPGHPLYGVNVVGINVGVGGRKPRKDHPGFRTLRSQLWWEAGREPIIAGRYDLGVLAHDFTDVSGRRCDTEEVVAELTSPTWKEQGGWIAVEPKDATKARIGHSPDDADAILLAFWRGGASVTEMAGASSRASMPKMPRGRR